MLPVESVEELPILVDDKVQRGVNQDVLAMKRSMLERRD